MKLWTVAIIAAMIAAPALGQINAAGADDRMKPLYDEANACLKAFDTKAKAKQLSAELYKAALDGVCTTEIRDMRAIYSLRLEGNENQDYLVARLDKNVDDARAKMVTDYVMR